MTFYAVDNLGNINHISITLERNDWLPTYRSTDVADTFDGLPASYWGIFGAIGIASVSIQNKFKQKEKMHPSNKNVLKYSVISAVVPWMFSLQEEV